MFIGTVKNMFLSTLLNIVHSYYFLLIDHIIFIELCKVAVSMIFCPYSYRKEILFWFIIGPIDENSGIERFNLLKLL